MMAKGKWPSSEHWKNAVIMDSIDQNDELKMFQKGADIWRQYYDLSEEIDRAATHRPAVHGNVVIPCPVRMYPGLERRLWTDKTGALHRALKKVLAKYDIPPNDNAMKAEGMRLHELKLHPCFCGPCQDARQ